MRVFMLGWEFPPFITGGLGTACHGLTRAMSRRDMEILFAIPKPVERDFSSHVTLLSPDGGTGAPSRIHMAPPTGEDPVAPTDITIESDPQSHVEFVHIPSEFVNPYQREAGEDVVGRTWMTPGEKRTLAGATPGPASGGDPSTAGPPADAPSPAPLDIDYGGDLIRQVERYAYFCVAAARHLDFDVIHAHDWMTYPAGMMVARATGKPLVVHIHSTEYDRSGEAINPRIADIERRGMHAALRVIAVSQLTKNTVVGRYALRPDQVEVVYNGVEMEPSNVGMTGIRRKDKVVLYFGRITYQKGPEYFIRAARRVLEYMDDVKFVVAGSGDMARRMIEMAAELGIGHKVLFTGFLRGKDIQRVFSIADLYVMPSVTEPFGIAPLEAMSHDVPVLISKTSGVSEVLTHALKVDFWDTEAMADKIIAVLRHPPLSSTLREHGAFEVRRLTWDGAAERCERVYRAVQHEVHALAGT